MYAASGRLRLVFGSGVLSEHGGPTRQGEYHSITGKPWVMGESLPCLLGVHLGVHKRNC